MDNRIFDVSKPHHSKPDATGKPVIVGHHPEMLDPMVREHAPDKPANAGHHISPTEPTSVPPVDEPSLPPKAPVAEHGDSFMEQPQINDQPTPKLPDLPTQPTVHGPAGLHPATPANSAAPHTAWHPDSQLPIPAHLGHHGSSRSRRKLPLIVLAMVVVLLGVYAAIDSGLVSTGIKMPFHIFSQDESAGDAPDSSLKSPTPTSATLPTSYVSYKVADIDVSFAYPASWGTPAVTKDPGFSKRGGNNQSSGTYAYLVGFATNKDVQIAVTSSQYLPVARTALYYDFQKWCTGTADGKFYKQLLRFTSTGGVDTPTTATCDQGPLADATKLDETTIVQLKTTNPDGSALGDLYTINLDSNDLPVLRVKDATSANVESIKKLLISVKN